MSRSTVIGIHVLACLFLVTATGLTAGTAQALTMLPGEDALWHFHDPGPLVPPYLSVGFHVDIDFGSELPTGVSATLYDDFPGGPSSTFDFLNDTGVEHVGFSVATALDPGFTDDLDFYLTLTNVGAHPFSFDGYVTGVFTQTASYDEVRVLPGGATAPVPEPAISTLLGIGLATLAGMTGLRRRR